MESNIGNRIKTFRELRELSQEQLAELCGVSTTSISRWENNTLYPKRNHLELLAQALGVSVTEFFASPEVQLPENVMLREMTTLMQQLSPSQQLFILEHLRNFVKLVEDEAER